MQIKNILLIAALFSSSLSFAGKADKEFDLSWLNTTAANENVYTLMEVFFRKEDPERDIKAYVDSFHSLMVAESQAAHTNLVAQNECKSFSSVQYPKSRVHDVDFAKKADFEAHFFKIESYNCLGKLNIDKVVQTFKSKSFQEKVMGENFRGIQSDSENRVCVQMSNPMGAADYCLTQNFHQNETGTMHIIHSFNDTDNTTPGDFRVFLKETITVITKLPDGNITVYNLMYVRSTVMNWKIVLEYNAEEMNLRMRKLLIEGGK